MSTTAFPHRLASTQDVIRQIIAQSDHATIAVCARVCQHWQDLALDVLWRNTIDVLGLLQILSPLRLVEGRRSNLPGVTISSAFHFVSRHCSKKWDRFYFYSRRILHLTLTELGTRSIDSSVFLELGRSRMIDRPMFLPNLLSFKVSTDGDASFLYSILFFQSTITTLDTKLPIAHASVANYLEEITDRVPSIQTLVLRFSTSVRPFEDALIHTFAKLRHLRHLTLPKYAITSHIMSALSTLTKLDTISWLYPTGGTGDRKDVEAWSPRLNCGSFPSLQSASVSAGFPDIAHFFRDESGPQSLASLNLCTSVLETTKSTGGLLFTIADRCSNLTHLCIDLTVGCTTTIAADLNADNGVRFSDMRSVLGIPAIRTFRICHHHRLIISDENVLEIARKWPAIQELWLNPDPITCSPPWSSAGPTPSCLTHFRNRCPSLRILGLHIDFSVQFDDFEGEEALMGGKLAGLERLELGTSPIIQTQVENAAVFLSALVTANCNVVSANDWPNVVHDVLADLPNDMAVIQQQWDTWDKVREVLPIVIRVREQERAAKPRST